MNAQGAQWDCKCIHTVFYILDSIFSILYSIFYIPYFICYMEKWPVPCFQKKILKKVRKQVRNWFVFALFSFVHFF